MKTTKVPKLTITEKRALRFCEALREYKGGCINVEWKRSAMWGSNPVIEAYGGKCTNISGCGYDKLSSALAQCLRFLFPIGSIAYNEVWQTGGAGESSTCAALAKYGWLLSKVGSGKSFDCYELKTPVNQN